MSRAVILAALPLLAACAGTKPWTNEPLQAQEVVRYDGRAQLFDATREPELLVVASFSGGGTRAAAFAWAVLEALDAEPFPWRGRPTSLPRQIDMVTGVSGGSVAAAHLALHGIDMHLAHFRDNFLTVDFQGRLVASALSARNLHRQSSPWFGRGQLLAEQLDETLFAGASFGTLADRPGHPYLIVGATDLTSGAEFDFTSEQLRELCTSIDHVPLAFAVAASSSVPLVFSPLTLASHRDRCTVPVPAAGGPSRQGRGDARLRLLQGEAEALRREGRRYVHLVDGGLSDNLGTRRIADYVSQSGGIGAVLLALRGAPLAPRDVPRRIVFLSINSERVAPHPIEQRGEVPSLLEVTDALVFSGLGRYSKETALVFADAVEEWRRELRLLAAPGETADIHNVQIALSAVPDAALRERVLAIPTSFRIAPEDLEQLRRAAAALVADSPEWRRFIQAARSDR